MYVGANTSLRIFVNFRLVRKRICKWVVCTSEPDYLWVWPTKRHFDVDLHVWNEMNVYCRTTQKFKNVLYDYSRKNVWCVATKNQNRPPFFSPLRIYMNMCNRKIYKCKMDCFLKILDMHTCVYIPKKIRMPTKWQPWAWLTRTGKCWPWRFFFWIFFVYVVL